MATFTEAQITDIASMFGTYSHLMDAHLDSLVSMITDADKTAILAQVARYQNGTVKGGVWFRGTESNEGFNMSSPNIADSRDPRDVVAGLIQWTFGVNNEIEFSLTRG
jgi:hypothetical protein